jgi:hypothetical protein
VQPGALYVVVVVAVALLDVVVLDLVVLDGGRQYQLPVPGQTALNVIAAYEVISEVNIVKIRDLSPLYPSTVRPNWPSQFNAPIETLQMIGKLPFGYELA